MTDRESPREQRESAEGATDEEPTQVAEGEEPTTDQRQEPSTEEPSPQLSADEPPAQDPKGEEPSTEQLQEPSTEKEPSEEPKAPDKKERPEPDHEAVGIGVIGRPQFDPDDTTPG